MRRVPGRPGRHGREWVDQPLAVTLSPDEVTPKVVPGPRPGGGTSEGQADALSVHRLEGPPQPPRGRKQGRLRRRRQVRPLDRL